MAESLTAKPRFVLSNQATPVLGEDWKSPLETLLGAWLSTTYEKPSSCICLEVGLEHQEEGGYVAFALDLPGCVSQGETKEEALAAIRTAAQALVDTYVSEGMQIPFEKVEELSDEIEEDKICIYG